MFSRNYAIVDVETTGGSPMLNRVIELGIIRVEHGDIAQTFKSLVNPERAVPAFISSITGISQRQVDRAPVFAELAEEIFPLFEDAVFVAHNSSFDYAFVKHEFQRLSWGFAMPSLCTVRLSRTLFPQYKKHSLDALVRRFDFSCKRRHRAYDDAKVLWDFLRYVDKNFEPAAARAAVERTIKKIPPKLRQAMAKLPQPEITYDRYLD